MPRKYILRLVFDRNHRSLALVKKNRVVGGICFRPQHEKKFAEIVFCAISSSQQVKGYGTRIMNTLKEHVKMEGIEYFLTYADNHAIGYLKNKVLVNLLLWNVIVLWDILNIIINQH